MKKVSPSKTKDSRYVSTKTKDSKGLTPNYIWEHLNDETTNWKDKWKKVKIKSISVKTIKKKGLVNQYGRYEWKLFNDETTNWKDKWKKAKIKNSSSYIGVMPEEEFDKKIDRHKKKEIRRKKVLLFRESGMTLEAIGKKFKVSKERIRQIIKFGDKNVSHSDIIKRAK